MSDDNNARYDDILRRIAARKAQESPPDESAQMDMPDLADSLDGLNAWGFLDDLTERELKRVQCFGPEVFKAPLLRRDWLGVVIWYKLRGYYHYETLWLLGIWALRDGDTITITVGTKALTFNAPAYNPESYYFHLKKRFDIYYDGDASPPPESDRRFSAVYDAARRLELRDPLQNALAAWAAEQA